MAFRRTRHLVLADPVNTTSTAAFTLASVDLASLNGGNAINGTFFLRATVTMFEVGGGLYSAAWEKCAVFRRTTGNPALVGSVVDGNQGSGGLVGSADTSTVTLDASGTSVRLRVTPSGAGSRDWFGRLELMAGQP